MDEMDGAYRWIRQEGEPPPCFTPENPEQAREWLRQRDRERAGVLIGSGAGHWFVGNNPTRVTHLLSVRKWDRILEYDPQDLTVTVESGCPLSFLQGELAKGGQFLPFSPVFAEKASVGGVIALGYAGRHDGVLGGPRQLLLGITVLHPDGEIRKAGGKVVKNVAGYDLCRLYTGSLGTLGVITQATFKVLPQPRSRLTYLVPSARLEEALEGALLLRRQQNPAALELLWPSSFWLPGSLPSSGGEYALAAELLDSVGDGSWRLPSLRQAGPGGMALQGKQQDRFWENWSRTFEDSLKPERGTWVLRVTASFSLLYELLQRALPRLRPAALTAHLQQGLLFLFCPHLEVGELLALRREWLPRHVFFQIWKGPAREKEGLDVWGESTQPLSLMSRLKEAFDPHGILNPGRFWGGL